MAPRRGRKPGSDPTLEVFILNMIAGGLHSPYDLQARAGVSIGASHPVLARLKAAKRIRASQEAAGRRKITYELTAAGKKYLAAQLEEVLKLQPSEFESAIRLACLAVFSGNRKLAASILRRVPAKHPPVEMYEIEKLNSPQLNKWILDTCESVRREAEHMRLRQIAKKLEQS